MSLRDSTVHEVGQLVYIDASKDIEFREYPIPEPGSDDVVTKVERTNVCDSELHVWRGDHPLSNCILGHKAIYRVSNLGEKVDTDGVGQQISEGDLRR